MPVPPLGGVRSRDGPGNTSRIAGVDLALTVNVALILSRPSGEQTTWYRIAVQQERIEEVNPQQSTTWQGFPLVNNIANYSQMLF